MFGSRKPIYIISNILHLDVSKDEYPSSATEVGDTKASEDPKPHLLWHAYFNIFERGVDTSQLPSNVYIMDGPGDQFGFDSAMNEVQRSLIFKLFWRSLLFFWSRMSVVKFPGC